jgi:hypothetical protein
VPLRKRRRLGTRRIPLHPTRVATHHARHVRCLRAFGSGASPRRRRPTPQCLMKGAALLAFAIFNEPITMTGVPKPQARGLASLNIIVERSRKRTVNS